MKRWNDKPYQSLNYYLQQLFHEKVIKIQIDAGFSCPNRDGTVGNTGCIFCSDRGSGDFAGCRTLSIKEQFQQGISLVQKKWPKAKYIIHFQAFTNTYAPIEVLKQKYDEALSLPNVVGLAIATRPDCLNNEVLNLLQEINQKTYLFVELGLQSMHDSTAERIHRGYTLDTFESAVWNLHSRNIEIVNHLIFGLPGESYEQMMDSVNYTASLPIKGVKLQCLYVVENTPLASLYYDQKLSLLDEDSYINLIIESIEHLPADKVIHRITGDGPKKHLLGPCWTKNKRAVLNHIHSEMAKRGSYQGKHYLYK